MAIEKNQIPGSPFGAISQTALPIWPNYEVDGLDWQCCLAGSSKRAPRNLIFSIAMGADNSYEVKNSEIWAPAFFKHNNSFIATVHCIV